MLLLQRSFRVDFFPSCAEGQESVWQLSLRPSQGAWREGVLSASATDDAAPETLNLGDLKIGQQVCPIDLPYSPFMSPQIDSTHENL